MVWFLVVAVVLALIVLFHVAIFATAAAIVAAVVGAFWALCAFVVYVWKAVGGAWLVAYALAHPWQALAWLAGYLLVGALWSIIHWYMDERDRVAQAKAAYSPHTARTMQEHLQSLKTKISYHTSDFKTWIAFWPVSIPVTVLNKPVRRIVTELQGIYQRITDHVWQ